MKKTFSFSLMAVAFIATLILAGCQQDANTLRVRIDNFGGNGKVYMGGDRFNVPTWSSGDTIWIDHGNNSDNSYILNSFNSSGAATLTVPNAPTYCALYPYTLGTVTGTTATITIPSVQPYYTKNNKQVVNAPMAAYTGNDQAGTMTFHNLGALLSINIENNLNPTASIDIDEVIVESVDRTLPLWGNATVDLSNPNAIYQCTPTGDDSYKVSLKKFYDNTHTTFTKLFTLASGETQSVYVYVPAVPETTNNTPYPNRYKITVKAHNGNTPITTYNTQQSSTGGSIPRNVMANVYFPMQIEVVPRGAIEGGKFTIKSGTTNNKVYFAAGNLQCQRVIENGVTTYNWRIANNQWDYVGGQSSSNPGNVSSSYNEGINDNTYTGWIDLFGWGTSGYNVNPDPDNPVDPYNTRYLPFDYDNSEVNATYNKYGYGPSTNRTNANYLQGANANYDWGVYHSNISGNASHGILQYQGSAVESNVTWRTLTQAEWNYLLNSRTFGSSTKKGKHWSWSPVTYRNRYGILIYPDGYTNQKTSSTNTHYTFPSNENLPAGCVFLPVSFQRTYADNTIQISTNLYCYYWTSQSGSSASPDNAYALYINPSGNGGTPSFLAYTRCVGNAVRLVTPVQ